MRSAKLGNHLKKSVNHSRTVASMRVTGWEQQQQRRRSSSSQRCVSDATVWSEFAFGPGGHCLLCCNQFLSVVKWSLRFPFFWSFDCHFMRFTALRTRPVNIDRKQCSSMPDFLTHSVTSLDAGSQALFLSRGTARLKEGPTLQYICRRVYIFKWKAQN